MFKIVSMMIFCMMVSNASIIHFEEEKYIDVLGNSIRKKGTLEFAQDTIKLQYQNSNRVLIYKDDNLQIQIDDEIQNINLNNQIALKMLFLLMQAIYTNDIEMIKEYFFIQKENDTTLLTPKENIKNYILSVEFKKNTQLEFIKVSMRNKNIITIRELDD